MSKYLLVRKGDIVFNKLRTWQGGLGVSAFDGIVSPAYFVCRPNRNVYPRYLHFLLRSRPYLDELSRISKWMPPSQFDISWDDLRNLPVMLPPMRAQRAIAGYLNHETARIDALIAARRRMALLLDERLRAAISLRVVERSEPPLALARICDCLPGYAFPSASMQMAPAAGVPLMRGVNVGIGRIDWTDAVYYPTDDIRGLDRYSLRPGDLLIGMDRPVIKGGIRVAEVTDADVPSLLVQRVARIRANFRTTNSYLKYVLASTAFVEHISPVMTGVSVPHVSGEQILSFRFPVPNLKAQAEIVEELDQLDAVCRSGKKLVVDHINLLEERRQTHITAAVSGQLDVPEAA